uniref:Telomerase RNA component interacting RNase n=1 Tax=Junco hyemalis TaxID=40217 RepID=A0A8C5IDK7_JUNHY
MAARGEDREAPEAPSPPPPGPGGGVNVFANDGSFLELFKRKMEAEEQQREREAAAAAAEASGGGGGGGTGTQRGGADGAKRSGGALSFVGRRRGGNKLALKTGVVAKKQKTDEEVGPGTGGEIWGVPGGFWGP